METQLYPGIAFSPPAALTDNIGAGDTIIPVSDAGSFPPAPNLATIGADEDGETILYAAKTATALAGCARGVEGTARAWSAGEPIARNWTAKDHADLIAAVREARAAAEEARAASDPAGTAAAAVEAHDGDAKAHGERFAAKQDALRGRPGEAVGFGANGVAMAVPGWSNPNLLDNWCFADPINQRGRTEYNVTGAAYTIDRWLLSQAGAKVLSIVENGISIEPGGVLTQKLEPGHIQDGTQITMSVMINYIVFSAGMRWDSSTGYTSLTTQYGFRLACDPSNRYVQIYNESGSGDDVINAVKLEPGPVQTLAHQDADGHWVLNDPPPNKALELAKCQRYLQPVKNGGVVSGLKAANTEFRFTYPLVVSMRARPEITGDCRITNVRLLGEMFTPTVESSRVGNFSESSVELTFTVSGSVGTGPANSPCVSYMSGGFLDANL